MQQAGATPVRMGTDSDVTLAVEAIALRGEPRPEATDPDARRAHRGRHRGPVRSPVRRHRGRPAACDAAGLPVVAVAQHDDQETRTLALDAGALRVYSYNKFFQDGAALVARWFVRADDARAHPGRGVTPHGIPARGYAARIAAAQAAARAAGVRALLIGVGPELEWLTGYEAKPLERLTHAGRARGGRPGHHHAAARGRRPRSRRRASGRAACASAPGWRPRIRSTWCWESVPAGPGARLVVSDTLRAAFLLRLQAAFPDAVVRHREPGRGSAATGQGCRRGGAAAGGRPGRGPGGDRVSRPAGSWAGPRRTWRPRCGHGWSTRATTAPASGSWPAAPGARHRITSRTTGSSRPGEPLLLDIGGRLGGYCSDITRTLWVTGADGPGPDDTFRTIHGLVLAANAGGPGCGPAGVPGAGPGPGGPGGHRCARDMARHSSIAWATASAWRATRTRTWWRATPRRSSWVMRSASSRASTSRVATASASRTSWSAPRPARTCSTRPPGSCWSSAAVSVGLSRQVRAQRARFAAPAPCGPGRGPRTGAS